MTWNLLGAQADGNLYDEHAGVAARVDQFAPDVLVLQEAQADDVDAIVNRSTTNYSVAAHQKWSCDLKSNAEGVAVLVRSSIVVAGTGATHIGESCSDPSVRRVLVWADVVLHGVVVRVHGTHLTAGGGAAAASRDAQIRELRARIGALDGSAAVDTWLLAGDHNARPGDSSYRLLVEGEPAASGSEAYLDTFTESSPVAGEPSSCPSPEPWDVAAMQQLLGDPQHVRRCGFTAGWEKDSNLLGCDLLSWCVSWERRRDLSVRERIDHVLRPDDGQFEVVAAEVPNRGDGDWAAAGAEWFRLSDHLPVVVDLALQQASGD